MQIQKQDPLFIQAYEIIKNKILTGELKPGERLFEVHLASNLGISRNPVREAFRLLMQDGLVCTTPNGQIVHPMNLDDINEIYECRMMVEPFAAALSAQRTSKEEAKELYQYVEKAAESYKAGAIDQVIEANSAFHQSIVLLSKNLRVFSIFKTIDNLVVVSRNIEMKVHHRPIDYLEDHQRMISMLEAADSKGIEDLMKSHIMADWQYFIKCSEKRKRSYS